MYQGRIKVVSRFFKDASRTTLQHIGSGRFASQRRRATEESSMMTKAQESYWRAMQGEALSSHQRTANAPQPQKQTGNVIPFRKPR